MVSPNRAQTLPFSPLTRKVSLYSIKLDEVQNDISDKGKPLSWMRPDEMFSMLPFNPQMPVPSSSSSSASMAHLAGNSSIDCIHDHKIIGDVWPNMAWQEDEGSSENLAQQWDTKLNFFARPGPINRGTAMGTKIEDDPQSLLTIDPILQQAEWFSCQLTAAQQQEEQQQHIELLSAGWPSYGSAILNGGGYAESHQQIGMPVVSMPIVTGTSSDSQTVIEAKLSDQTVDKSIDRRQKRMIKNRESAARSRARKQAYICQLEEEVRKLTAKIGQLKREKEEDMKLPFNSTPTRFQLRRTSSVPLF